MLITKNIYFYSTVITTFNRKFNILELFAVASNFRQNWERFNSIAHEHEQRERFRADRNTFRFEVIQKI